MSGQPAVARDRLALPSLKGLWVCQRRPITLGQRVRIIGSWSEVCLHLRVADKPVDVELIATNSPNGYMAQLYQPGCAERYSMPILEGEAGIFSDASGQRWAWERVEPTIAAGWEPRVQRLEDNRYVSDRWAEAQSWLAGCVADRATDAQWWAEQSDCTPPACQSCRQGCWVEKARELTGLAEALQQPGLEPRWSATAAGVTYWIRRERP